MSYADLTEFTRVLRLDNPTDDQLAAAQRALDAATQEIDAYLSWDVTPPVDGDVSPDGMALVVQVNIDRAAEHWRLTPYGALNQGPDVGTVLVARNSWYRHAQTLASLKDDWGVS
jgi:hypothetical protein